jgi:hypothetical protein
MTMELCGVIIHVKIRGLRIHFSEKQSTRSSLHLVDFRKESGKGSMNPHLFQTFLQAMDSWGETP